MESIFSLLFSVLPFVFLVLFSQQASSYGGIGAIVDLDSRIGKEEKVAMEMAIDDFSTANNQKLTLLVMNSHGEPIHAAAQAAHLINEQHVQAILGPRTWEESSLVSEIGSRSQTPILSFADSSPNWATTRWPFLIQASPQIQQAQMKAGAAIIQSWGWRRVIALYEDTDSFANGVIPHLHASLQEVGAEISSLIGLPPFASSSLLSEELNKVRIGQCRVIVVHASLPLALRLFEQAKNMEMMEQGYVWITTDSITSQVHAINSSAISSMQGVLGIKSYFREFGHLYSNFYTRFTRKFGSENPEERYPEPGIFALQAYDATRAVAVAILAEGTMTGWDLLEKIVSTDFDGLSGEVRFMEGKLAPPRTLGIINVVGKSYKEIGFWSDGDGKGFSKTIDRRAIYNESMQNLGQVFWPGEPRLFPKGWTLPTSGKKLRIAVPNGTLFNQDLSIAYDPLTNTYTFSGFSVEVFKSTVALLPYDFPYEFVLSEGTFNDMVEKVHLKKYDGAIGPIAITAQRYNIVDFSQPHTDTALVMVVPVQSLFGDKAWMFLKPFTKAMWVLIALINVYNGFVVWMIEREHCSSFGGSILNQVGTLLWLAFATLFSRDGEKLHSNLSRMATVVWLFVALVITQSYTANLTSMLTVPRLEPTVADMETLKYNNAMIGSFQKAFVSSYLVDVLKFSPNNMKNYSAPEEIAQALRKKEIQAAFLESPAAKLFLARYCKSFITAGPTYKIGGYGFAFPKGSPVLSDINEALLQVIDSGTLRKLENSVTTAESCVDVESDNNNVSLSPGSFCVLFILTGGTSTIALAIYLFLSRRKHRNSMHEHMALWILMFGVRKCWLLSMNRFSRRVSHAETPKPGSPPNTLDQWNHVQRHSNCVPMEMETLQ